MQSMRKLLVIADAIIPTGFARVADAILRRLVADFEIHQLGISYFGPPVDDPWHVYPTPCGQKVYPFQEAEKKFVQIDTDLVFIINDLWIVNIFAERLKSLNPAIPIVSYSPVDTDPLEPEVVVPLFLHVDKVVTYTQFSRSQIRSAALRAQGATGFPVEGDIAVIPHGVDTQIFQPLAPPDNGFASNRRLARMRLFPNNPELQDAFIVLNANRNQPRKRIDLTIELFALFSAGKPENVKLYLHMAREDIAGWDIFTLARRFGVLHRLIVSTQTNRLPALTPQSLNLLYNACEVGLNTCSAEGWGLVAFEHAAAGGAQMVPAHTTQTELWDGAAILLPPRFVVTSERGLGQAYFIAPEEGAEALDRLYEDRVHLDNVARACFTRATAPALSWDCIVQQWRTLLFHVAP